MTGESEGERGGGAQWNQSKLQTGTVHTDLWSLVGVYICKCMCLHYNVRVHVVVVVLVVCSGYTYMYIST